MIIDKKQNKTKSMGGEFRNSAKAFKGGQVEIDGQNLAVRPIFFKEISDFQRAPSAFGVRVPDAARVRGSNWMFSKD